MRILTVALFLGGAALVVFFLWFFSGSSRGITVGTYTSFDTNQPSME